jgi:hypothetical protein
MPTADTKPARKTSLEDIRELHTMSEELAWTGAHAYELRRLRLQKVPQPAIPATLSEAIVRALSFRR